MLLCATLYLTHERILLAMGDFLVVKDTLKPGDVIHVIAGEDYRTDYAIQLFRQGFGKVLFFTGGWCPFHNENHGDRANRRALQQGIRLKAVVIDDFPVTSTYEEVLRLKEFMRQSVVPLYSVIVVSDSFHSRRARWTYRQILGDEVKVQMAPVSFELSPYKRDWWTDRASRQFVKEEYLKMIYYHARYQLSWGPVKEWLASLDRK
jgi:uncharacterized SAM-binding protein YcdF (DUF218 family)